MAGAHFEGKYGDMTEIADGLTVALAEDLMWLGNSVGWNLKESCDGSIGSN